MFRDVPESSMFRVLLTPPRKHRVCAMLLSSVPFSFCTRLYVLSVCFASQTPGLCNASIFGSLPLLHTFICFVSVLRLANTGFVQCFYLRFPSPFAYVYLFCQCASPRKHRVCAVLLSSVPFPFCIRLFVLSVCFASQTPGLCCASLLHTFVCVSVLCLANSGFVLCCFLPPL